MRIKYKALNRILAERCMCLSDLSGTLSRFAMARLHTRKCVSTRAVGTIARVLGCTVDDLI